jgi:hypothetical protein
VPRRDPGETPPDFCRGPSGRPQVSFPHPSMPQAAGCPPAAFSLSQKRLRFRSPSLFRDSQTEECFAFSDAVPGVGSLPEAGSAAGSAGAWGEERCGAAIRNCCNTVRAGLEGGANALLRGTRDSNIAQ